MFRSSQLLVIAALAFCASASQLTKAVRRHQEFAGEQAKDTAFSEAVSTASDVEAQPKHKRAAHAKQLAAKVQDSDEAEPAKAPAKVEENAVVASADVVKHAAKVEESTKVAAADSEQSTPGSVHDSVHDSADAVNAHAAHYKKASAGSASKLLAAYGVAMVAMIACVSVMFYQLGAAVVFQVVLYVGCLAFVKIALKMVYEYNFHYPKFITAVHLIISSSAGFVVLLHRRATTGKALAVPTKDELLFGVLPIASTFGFSIASENSALVFVSAAFSEVVASTNPVMSFSLTWVLGMGANLKLLAPIGVVVLGCVISVEGEMYFSAVGLILLLLSVFFRGLKAVMQQKLMTGETKEKFDPVTLMAWTCMFAFLVVFAYSLATEGLVPFNAIAESTDVAGLMAVLLGSAAIACTLNISALFVIKQLGAVGMQMVSQMKSLLVVIGGMALLGESFTNMQKLGFAIVLSGVYWYSRVQRQASAQANAAAKGS